MADPDGLLARPVDAAPDFVIGLGKLNVIAGDHLFLVGDGEAQGDNDFLHIAEFSAQQPDGSGGLLASRSIGRLSLRHDAVISNFVKLRYRGIQSRFFA